MVEIRTTAHWPVGVAFFLLIQWACWLWIQAGVKLSLLIPLLLVLQGWGLIVAFNLGRRPKRLFINDSQLLIKDWRGRLIRAIYRPRGRISRLCLLIRYRPLGHAVVWVWQVDSADYKRLARWLRSASFGSKN